MNKLSIKNKIPEDTKETMFKIIRTFYDNDFECFLIGGSVRDLILGNEVYDYDFATNARPEQVVKLFKKVIPTGIKHGTVSVFFDGRPFEITTYRSDGKYIDGRRPESVLFSKTLKEDIARRDFTINGLAYDVMNDKVIDHVEGIKDLKKGIIKTIGDPVDRFNEDGLRTYRACRFAAKLNFKIEEKTFEAISQTLDVTKKISAERIRDEFLKILEAPLPSIGFEYLRKTGLLNIFLPELDDAFEKKQNKYHMYDIYYHSVYSCDAGPQDKPLIRLAALLHDIGKVPTRKIGDKDDYVFYNHEVIGAKMVRKIMKRLKFSNGDIDIVNNLVINHMFHYTDDWTDGAVRRFMRKVGVENLDDLLLLRKADRKGNGARSGLPVPILKLQKRIEKIIEEENAITVKDLEINGHDIMNEFNFKEGPMVGKVLNELLELVLDEPDLNEKHILLEKAREISESFK